MGSIGSFYLHKADIGGEMTQTLVILEKYVVKHKKFFLPSHNIDYLCTDF